MVAFLLSICLWRKPSECLRRFWCGVWLALVLLLLATLVLPKWSVRAPVVRELVAPPVMESELLPQTIAVPLSDDVPLEVISPKRSIGEILVQAWIAVACLLLLRLFVSRILLYRLRRRLRSSQA